ncbi:type I polyketide synthase [Paenibacillus vini]|uniref:type I polyketide synthase n=1 Tax=Paenibacillus vini TaxID=1476024 RepID=UPI0025B713FB|nr:type I polyketide synthase [Paenibacillus vini]MDN4066699.1 type I polyketide synthase [Paenibacillus vini]
MSDIAIIGMSCRFPGADSLDQFWENLKNGIESITFFSDEELAATGVRPELLQNPNYVRASALLDQIDMFDAEFFGFSPKEARITDPQKRIFLECVYEALEQAGVTGHLDETRTGVFAGSFLSHYLMQYLQQSFDRDHPSTYLQTLIGNDKDYLSTLVSYKLNLKGPSLNVQTACSTSLASVALACQHLLNYDCDMAIAGGVSVRLPQREGYVYQEGGAFSADGHCRPFDYRANGTVFGSGAGVVILKRLDDALETRDPILAVIKGYAVNNDGAGKVGFAAPSVNGQAEAIRMAQAMAEVEPESISMIEAHGTATQLGDPIELQALSEVFGKQSQAAKTCAIGSVKSNIGHADVASGVAGLIKAVLALQHKQLPPSLHFEKPSPQLHLEDTPFYVNTTLTDWNCGPNPRRCGVSSFGFGGTNVHVVLEEAPVQKKETCSFERPMHVLTLSAKNTTALRQLAQRYVDYINNKVNVNIGDFCYSANDGRADFEYRKSFILSDVTQLINQLQQFALSSEPILQAGFQPAWTLVLNGDMVEYSRQAATFFETQPIFREYVLECASVMETAGFPPILDAIHGRCEFHKAAGFAVEYAMTKLWISWIGKPSSIHSVGWSFYASQAAQELITLEQAMAALNKDAPEELLPEIVGYPIIMSVSWSKTLASIAKLFELGMTIVWSNFEQKYARQTIPLPTYPWQRKSYWISEGVVPHAKGIQQLIGTKLALPFSDEIRYQNRINLQQNQHLNDHRLLDQVVVPAASHIAMVLSAFAKEEPSDMYRLEDIIFPRALIINDETDKFVQLIISPTKKHTYSYKIVSLEGSDEKQISAWKVNGSGCIYKMISDLPSYDLNLQDLKIRCKEHLKGDAFYQLFRDGGYNLGHSYSWIQDMWRGHREGVCQLTKPSKSDVMEPYQLTTCLIDSCFHLLNSCRDMPTKDLAKGEHLIVPFRIEELNIYQLPNFEDTYWCHSFLTEDDTEEGLKGNMRLVNKNGDMIIEIVGFEGRKVSKNSLTQHQSQDFASHVYKMSWSTLKLPSSIADKPKLEGAWLIVTDKNGIGHRLADIIQSHGGNCKLIHPEDPIPSDLKTVTGVVYLGGLDAPHSTESTVKVLRLIQDLKMSFLVLITQNSQWVIDTQTVMQPYQATLWGMGQVINQEYSNLFCQNIDLEAQEAGLQAELLYRELLHLEGKENNVAYRQNQRFVKRMLPKKVELNSFEGFKEQATYVLAGGGGELGLNVAQWIVANGGRNLVLLSRQEPRAKAQSVIRHLQEQNINVLMLQVDITDIQALQEAWVTIRAKMPPVKGIFQLAGVVEDSLLEQVTIDSFQRVLAPKVTGTWNLHQITSSESLDVFICFSSLSAVLGTEGQGSYAAANAFLDAFSYFLRAKGLPGLSISWGPWETGMAAELEERQKQRIVESGIGFLTLENGLSTLGQLISQPDGQLIVASLDLLKLASKYSTLQTLIQSLLLQKKMPEVHEFQDLSNIEAVVMHQVKTVLDLPNDQLLSPEVVLQELGLDSLGGVDLQELVYATFGIKITIQEILRSKTTIESLTQIIEQQLLLRNAVAEKETDEMSDGEYEEITI